MASVSEIQSLENISYKSKVKFYLWPLIFVVLVMMAFLNYYPFGEKLKEFLQKNLAASGCNLNYDSAQIKMFLPKVIITDLNIPAQCLERTGNPIKLNHLTVNFQFISFVPFGLPFRIDTEYNGQPLSLYFVQGFSERMIRIKDQTTTLSKLGPLLEDKVKLSGKVTTDLTVLLSNSNLIKSLELKAQSKDFVIPPQSIEGFTTPKMKVNDFYLEVNSKSPSKIMVEKLIIGDTESPMRASFKGTIDLKQANLAISPMTLSGEIAFSPSFKENVPLIDMFFQKFTQKDGFYQLKLGGMLGRPQLLNP